MSTYCLAHSATEGHWVVSFWDGMNAVASDIHVHVLCGPQFLLLLGKYLRVGLLVAVGSILLTL